MKPWHALFVIPGGIAAGVSSVVSLAYVARRVDWIEYDPSLTAGDVLSAGLGLVIAVTVGYYLQNVTADRRAAKDAVLDNRHELFLSISAARNETARAVAKSSGMGPVAAALREHRLRLSALRGDLTTFGLFDDSGFEGVENLLIDYDRFLTRIVEERTGNVYEGREVELHDAYVARLRDILRAVASL